MQAEFKVHLSNLLSEYLSNNGTGVLRLPTIILAKIMAEISDRCIELNDPVLNHLMCRLQVYDVSDPQSENYDKDAVNKIEAKYLEYINKNK